MHGYVSRYRKAADVFLVLDAWEGHFFVSSIDGAIGSVLAAREAAQQTQIAYAVQAKSMDAAKQQAEAVVELVAQAAKVAKSLGSGTIFNAIG